MSKRLERTMSASENSLHIIFNPLFINGTCKLMGDVNCAFYEV